MQIYYAHFLPGGEMDTKSMPAELTIFQIDDLIRILVHKYMEKIQPPEASWGSIQKRIIISPRKKKSMHISTPVQKGGGYQS